MLFMHLFALKSAFLHSTSAVLLCWHRNTNVNIVLSGQTASNSRLVFYKPPLLVMRGSVEICQV